MYSSSIWWCKHKYTFRKIFRLLENGKDLRLPFYLIGRLLPKNQLTLTGVSFRESIFSEEFHHFVSYGVYVTFVCFSVIVSSLKILRHLVWYCKNSENTSILLALERMKVMHWTFLQFVFFFLQCVEYIALE